MFELEIERDEQAKELIFIKELRNKEKEQFQEKLDLTK